MRAMKTSRKTARVDSAEVDKNPLGARVVQILTAADYWTLAVELAKRYRFIVEA